MKSSRSTRRAASRSGRPGGRRSARAGRVQRSSRGEHDAGKDLHLCRLRRRTALPRSLARNRRSDAKADPFPKDELSDRYAAAAESILKQSGVTRGFCLVLGSEQGRLAYELAKRSELIVFGVEADEKKVAAARAALMKTGLYGPRDHLRSPRSQRDSVRELLRQSHRVRQPAAHRRGARRARGCRAPSETHRRHDLLRRARQRAGRREGESEARTSRPGSPRRSSAEEKATIETADNWSRLVRAALPGAGAWSHQYGNAGEHLEQRRPAHQGRPQRAVVWRSRSRTRW